VRSVQQVAGARVEQRQQVGRGEAAAGRLGAGLAELLLEFGCVRHGEAGAVEQPDAMAAPAAAGVAAGVGQAAPGDGAAEAVEEGYRQAAAGLAVGRVGKVQPSEVPQPGGGDVALQDLAEEEVGGDDGGEGALAEGEAEFVAVLADERFGDMLREVALDAAQGLGDSKHGGLRHRMLRY